MVQEVKILFLFLDGIGLGVDDPAKNPFAVANMPNLHSLLGGVKLLAKNAPLVNERATLRAVDAGLGISGLPQSATGQAVLLTGVNVPAELGYHYGPKPNSEVAAYIKRGSVFSRLLDIGKHAAFINAYPPNYFEAIQSGRRLYAAIPLAAVSSGVPLRTQEDMISGQAISADFTGLGWHTHLGLTDVPIYSPYQAGEKLVELTGDYDFALFEYWLSDYAGHHQDMQGAIELLETFDRVLEGLLNSWDDQTGLILLTSDHGNMEDLSTRRHTNNTVPLLLIGAPDIRRIFESDSQMSATSNPISNSSIKSLTDITPAILRTLINSYE